MNVVRSVPLIADPPGELASVGDRYAFLLEQLTSLQPVSPERSYLVEAAIVVWSRPGFDTFASLAELRFEPFEHQLRAAAVALRQMGGRAILADEVGLGKTIEAGIVLTELRWRSLARNVLVLAPTGLIRQWGEELERKFAVPTVVATRDGWTGDHEQIESAQHPVVLASLATARRDPLRELLAARAWDLVIVDEAHRVRNPRTASSRLVRSLRTRFMLLLTATPVENRIDDLFHLVSLVRPGHLGTIADFRRRYVAPSSSTSVEMVSSEEPTTGVTDLRGLRHSLRSVMVRHRRSEVALMLPRRLVEAIPVQPSSEEAELYHRVSERVRIEGRAAGSAHAMALRTVQRLAGSSPLALAPTLERLGWPELAQQARSVGACAKSAALATVLERHANAGEKVIVFTSFRETLAHLTDMARAKGIRSSQYHGGLGRREKDAAIEDFEHVSDVLFSTESAGEGRNLQFCHTMVNFDLPWNPMLIEQRLGRIHRIGQTHDVMLTNLYLRGTIEEHILDILHTKLNLFELVVGELDMVLGRVREDFVFEQAIFDAHVESRDDDELVERLSALGTALVQARQGHQASRAWTDELVAELEGADGTSSGATEVP